MIDDATIRKEINFMRRDRDDEMQEALRRLELVTIDIAALKERIQKAVKGGTSFGTVEGIPDIISALVMTNDILTKAKAHDTTIKQLDSLLPNNEK